MLIIDRIEGEFAVCELPDKTTKNIPLARLPSGVREGDCLVEGEEGLTVDRAETDRRRKAAADLFRSLLEGKGNG